jgi:hypothetical protein
MPKRLTGRAARTSKSRTDKRFSQFERTNDRVITNVFVPNSGVFMPSGIKAGLVPMVSGQIGQPIPQGGDAAVAPDLFVASNETGGLGATGSMVAVYNPVTDTFSADYNDIRAITNQITEGVGYGATADIAWGAGSSITYGKFGALGFPAIYRIDALDASTRIDLLPSYTITATRWIGSAGNKALFRDGGSPPNFQIYDTDTGLWEAAFAGPVGSRAPTTQHYSARRQFSPDGTRIVFVSNTSAPSAAFRGVVVWYDANTTTWSNIGRPAASFNVDYAQVHWISDTKILYVGLLSANNNYLGLWTYSLDPDDPLAGSWQTVYDTQNIGPGAFAMVSGAGTLLDGGTKIALLNQNRQLALVGLESTNDLLGLTAGPGAGAIAPGAYPWVGGNTSAGFVVALSANWYRVVYDSGAAVANSLTGYLPGASPVSVPAWYNSAVGFWTPHD